MNSTLGKVIYLLVMVTVVVSTDILFWQHHTEIRLFGNIGIVAVFALAYFLLFERKQRKK